MYKQLKYSDIPQVRKELLEKQNYICPLCERKITKPALDHAHKRQGGNGCIRQVLCSGCNAYLGKIENNHNRNNIPIEILHKYLCNVVDYMTTKHTNLIHPKENKTKKKKLGKRQFNLVLKYWDKTHPNKKKPVFKKGMGLTKEWIKWIKEAENIKNKG